MGMYWNESDDGQVGERVVLIAIFVIVLMVASMQGLKPFILMITKKVETLLLREPQELI
jgi:hypothetical protein